MNQDSRCVVVDVETTGLSPGRGGRVIEIGAVAVENGEIAAEFSTLINANSPIAPGAYRVHGISRAMLRGKPAPDDVWPSFLRFIADSPLIAHNSPFDSSFIRHELALLGQHLPNPWHCTVRLARRRLPFLSNHRLETVARHLIPDLPADLRLHRALDDARLTAKVWLALQA